MNKSQNTRNNLVIKGTRIGVWDWNIQTGEAYFNERWAEIIGYTLDELAPISIETWIKFAHTEDLEVSNTLLKKHFEGESEYYDFQSRMKHKSGHWVWVHDRGKISEWDDQGQPLRMCGSHIEITQQKQLEHTLKRTVNEKNILLKEVHHRVKNNLQLLLSLTRLKNKDGMIEIHEIEDSIISISRAYEAMYKADSFDKISIKKYFNEIIDYILDGYGIVFKLNSFEFKSNIDFLIPLGLIITELINNSLKHAFDNVDFKKIEITIETEKDQLIINYADNGVGYADKTLKSIDTNEAFGLNIIVGLIEQLDGRFEFYNDNGASIKIKITNPNTTCTKTQ